MQATELFLEGGKPSGIFFCGTCRAVKPNQAEAEKCCTCFTCGKVIEKGASAYNKHGGSERQHARCFDARQAELEQGRIEKAKKLAHWEGPVFLDCNGGNGDGYFESLGELVDWLDSEQGKEYWGELGFEEEPVQWPLHAWPCIARRTVELKIDDVISNLFEGWEEEPKLDGLHQLYQAVKAFEEKNAGFHTYDVIKSKVIVLPRSADEFYKKG